MWQRSRAAGFAGWSARDENARSHVCNYCATNASGKQSGGVEMVGSEMLANFCAGWSYGDLAEGEGFEPSVQVTRTTV